jgi:hypothetical protein
MNRHASVSRPASRPESAGSPRCRPRSPGSSTPEPIRCRRLRSRSSARRTVPGESRCAAVRGARGPRRSGAVDRAGWSWYRRAGATGLGVVRGWGAVQDHHGHRDDHRYGGADQDDPEAGAWRVAWRRRVGRTVPVRARPPAAVAKTPARDRGPAGAGGRGTPVAAAGSVARTPRSLGAVRPGAPKGTIGRACATPHLSGASSAIRPKPIPTRRWTQPSNAVTIRRGIKACTHPLGAA